MAEPAWQSVTTSAQMDGVVLPGGAGALAIKNVSSGFSGHLECAIDTINAGTATFQPTNDTYEAEVSEKLNQFAQCMIKLVVDAGTCDVFIRPATWSPLGRPT